MRVIEQDTAWGKRKGREEEEWVVKVTIFVQICLFVNFDF